MTCIGSFTATTYWISINFFTQDMDDIYYVNNNIKL
jgi:hypothetical protein